MLEMIWGLKTQAIFDAWVFEHVLIGISIGTAVWKRNYNVFKKVLNVKEHNHHSWHFDLTGVLFLAYIWETIEHYLEIGLAGGAVEYWFQGVEFWPNRILADPVLLILGYLFAKRFPRAVWPARILSLAWLIAHVFIFPHSMYLHYVF